MQSLFDRHVQMIRTTPNASSRQYVSTIHWDLPLIAIRGPKGVGKSTIMRQFIQQHYDLYDRSVLYCSCDGVYFASHSLLELADNFYKHGGKHLFLDEIHHYDNWSQEIKEMYDLYPDMRVVISGSSLLKLMTGDADLSRRCINYDIQGLSFREYLHLYKGIELPSCSLEDLLAHPGDLCQTVNHVCHPLAYFHDYLETGYYPFGNKITDKVDYFTTLEQVVNNVIDYELVRICKVDITNVRKIKALVNILAQSVPYEVDIQKIASQSNMQRKTVLEYLSHLSNGKIIQLLYSDLLTVKKLQKPDKIYLENSNLLYALATTPVHIGTAREVFAVNQLSERHTVEYSKQKGDFRIDGKYTIEVGGADKSYKQIADIPNSYILADDMEHPYGNKLPLWSLGFLY